MKPCYNSQTMQKQAIDDFWSEDIFMFNGVFPYFGNKPMPIRGKLHTSEEKYTLGENEQNIRPVETLKGNRTYIMMHPYFFEPVLTFSVGLYQKPKLYADQEEAIGETIGKAKQEGVRDVQIGSAQAWYYHEDKIIEIWECFLDADFRTHPFVHDTHMKKLWQGFERWLVEHFPQATRIVTPFHDPIAQTIEEYQEFLRSQGFEPVAKSAFGKQLK